MQAIPNLRVTKAGGPCLEPNHETVLIQNFGIVNTFCPIFTPACVVASGLRTAKARNISVSERVRSWMETAPLTTTGEENRHCGWTTRQTEELVDLSTETLRWSKMCADDSVTSAPITVSSALSTVRLMMAKIRVSPVPAMWLGVKIWAGVPSTELGRAPGGGK